MEIPEAKLQRALQDGATVEAWIDYYDRNGKGRRAGGLWTLRPVCLGRLPITSGELIAGDIVFGLDMTAPFERRVPIGEFEVWATLAMPAWPRRLLRYLRWGGDIGCDPIVAFLTLVLRDETPVRYEFAKSRKPARGDRPIDEFPGFGVDSASAGLIDAAHQDAVRALSADDLWKLKQQLRAGPSKAAGRAALIQLPMSPPVRAAMSRSGWGDGAYLSYWGLGRDGEPVRLIVDFNLAREQRSRMAKFRTTKEQRGI